VDSGGVVAPWASAAGGALVELALAWQQTQAQHQLTRFLMLPTAHVCFCCTAAAADVREGEASPGRHLLSSQISSSQCLTGWDWLSGVLLRDNSAARGVFGAAGWGGGDGELSGGRGGRLLCDTCCSLQPLRGVEACMWIPLCIVCVGVPQQTRARAGRSWLSPPKRAQPASGSKLRADSSSVALATCRPLLPLVSFAACCVAAHAWNRPVDVQGCHS
jgi:hypothetical protein